MKRSKFSEAQIAFILRQGDEGTAIGEVCRKAGISEATYYNWRKKYGGLMPSEMKRLRQLEEENGKLKKIVADLVARQGDAAGRHPPKALKPARKRQLVDHARTTWRVSIRRACLALPVDRSTYHYRSRRTGQAQLIERIKEIAATRVRYGYRRIQVLLRREGWRVNTKRVCRLYREMGLQLRNKTPKRGSRRSCARTDGRRRTRTRPGRWTSCMISLRPGGRLRVLTIIDTFSRFSPAIEPRFNFRGADVVEILERGRPAEFGYPKTIRVDKEPSSSHGSRPLGLSTRRDARLLPTGKTH